MNELLLASAPSVFFWHVDMTMPGRDSITHTHMTSGFRELSAAFRPRYVWIPGPGVLHATMMGALPPLRRYDHYFICYDITQLGLTQWHPLHV